MLCLKPVITNGANRHKVEKRGIRRVKWSLQERTQKNTKVLSRYSHIIPLYLLPPAEMLQILKKSTNDKFFHG